MCHFDLKWPKCGPGPHFWCEVTQSVIDCAKVGPPISLAIIIHLILVQPGLAALDRQILTDWVLLPAAISHWSLKSLPQEVSSAFTLALFSLIETNSSSHWDHRQLVVSIQFPTNSGAVCHIKVMQPWSNPSVWLIFSFIFRAFVLFGL